MRAFTLMELAVVIAILGIVLAIAAPSLNALTLNQRVRSGVTDLQASMFYARSEALKRGANVYIFPVGNGWANGWRICTDSLCTNSLRQETVLANKLQVTLDPAAVATSVAYGSDGRLIPGGPIFIRISTAASSTVAARCVNFSLSGSPRVVIDKDAIAANGC